MSLKSLAVAVILLSNLSGLSGSPWGSENRVYNKTADESKAARWTSYQVIDMVNGQRVAYGNSALIVDPILMATAQSTAEIMAANNMHSHIGDVRGRVQAAGYGAGDIPWATENFAVCSDGSEDMIASAWADATHQIPVVNSNYKHVGAGVAVASNGMVYYILHAAYTSNGTYESGSSGYTSSSSTTSSSSSSTSTDATSSESSSTEIASQYINAVVTVTPSSNGKLVHTVQYGQSMWSIAIAYNTHIVDIAELNGLDSVDPVIWAGQELVIPSDGSLTVPDTGTEEEQEQEAQPATEITRTPILTLTSALDAVQPTQSPQQQEPKEGEIQNSSHDGFHSGILGMVIAGVLLIVIGLFASRSQ